MYKNILSESQCITYLTEKNCIILNKKENIIHYKCLKCESKYQMIIGEFYKLKILCSTCRSINTKNTIKNVGNKLKFTYEYVYNTFKEQKCELLTKDYIDCNKKLEFKCFCGRISKIQFCRFKKIKHCKHCSRDKVKQKLLDEYGVENYAQLDASKEKSKNTCLQKYGCEYSAQHIDTKNKMKNTILQKYNVENICQLANKNCSKESKLLFDEVYKLLPINLLEKCHYASLKGGEYCIKYQNKFFKYDFVNTITKTCIEYNGFNFHPRPTQLDEEVGWFAFDKNKTVKEARDYEKIKYQGLEERGYKILTVWDYEFKSNPTQLIQRCVDFITLGNLQ